MSTTTSIRPARKLTLEQRAANSARALRHYYKHKKLKVVAFDRKLTKPVHVASTPPPPRPAAEVARLRSELSCLRRERDTTQRAIDHLLQQLAT
jgi:hypothetical protein